MKKTTSTNRRHSAPSKKKNFASLIFSFLLSLTLVVIAVFLVAYCSLSEGHIVSGIDSEYINMLHENVYNAAVDYTIPTGLDVSVLDGVFTEEAIGNDIRSYVRDTFNGVAYEVDTSNIHSALKANAEAFLTEHGLDPTTEMQAVDEYANDICVIYKDRIKLPGLSYLIKLSNILRKCFMFVIIGGALFAFVNAFLCLKLHSYFHRGLRYPVYSFGGAALMTFVAPFGAYLNGFYKRLQISPNYFKSFIVNFSDSIFKQLFIWAGSFFVLFILSLFAVGALRKRAIKKESHRKKR